MLFGFYKIINDEGKIIAVQHFCKYYGIKYVARLFLKAHGFVKACDIPVYSERKRHISTYDGASTSYGMCTTVVLFSLARS